MRKDFLTARAVLVAAVASVALTGCHDRDVFMGDRTELEYEAAWGNKFGNVDPQQNWNLATQVNAVVKVSPIAAGSKVCVYDANPYTDDARLMAETRLFAENVTLGIDMLKGASQVYACVLTPDGKVQVRGFYDVANGAVEITDSPVPQRRAALLPHAGESCDVTFGTTYDLGYFRDAETVYDWDGKTYCINGQFYRYEDGHYYMNTDGNPDGNYILIPDEWKGDWNQFPHQWAINGDWGSPFYDGWKYLTKTIIEHSYGSVTELENVSRTAGMSWKQGVGYGMFGTGKFFAEHIKYFDEVKSGLDGYDLTEIEKGAAITTAEAGPLSLSMIFGATQNSNAFGYFYYEDGQNPDDAPRYILIKNARPQDNIYTGTWGQGAVGNMQLEEWSSYEYAVEHKDDTPYESEVANGNTPMSRYLAAYNKLYVGTRYKVPYFGRDYQQEAATYTFPAGVHIEFFIINNENPEKPNYKQNLNNFNYGTPGENLKIEHYRERTGFTPDFGAVKATTWMYEGIQYIGFEDGGADEDLNDVVLAVEGKTANTPGMEVPPVEPAAETQAWTVACEDLGSTDDYDFNDVVFQVKHASGSTTATVVPLAAGGVYSARILYNSSDLGEIHGLINPNASSSTMLNTTTYTPAVRTVSVTVPEDFSMANGMGGFSIQVEGRGTTVTISGPATGSVPQMICVPGSWVWPLERQPIEQAYPDFCNWSQNAQNYEWYKNVNSGKVVPDVTF
ncbi:MAG: LruC domain-containing protein [Prevotella sp.]